MRLFENLGGGGIGKHLSAFPRTCLKQVLLGGNYTTRGKGLPGFPRGFEPRRLSGLARCEACPVIAIELRLPGTSRVGPVDASGSGWAWRERGPAGEPRRVTPTAYGASQE